MPYSAFPILNILVLQVGHVPLVAGFPFFIVTALVFCISLLLLHFTQYPVVMVPILEGGAISRMLLKFFNFWVIEMQFPFNSIQLSFFRNEFLNTNFEYRWFMRYFYYIVIRLNSKLLAIESNIFLVEIFKDMPQIKLLESCKYLQT